MEPLVIDAIHSDAGDRLYPGFNQFMSRDSAKAWAEYDAKTKIPDCVSVDGDAWRQLEDWACDVFAYGTEQGFRDGFRLAARLMMECLPAPELPAVLESPKAPKKGDGA